jgi:hypothetical protein
MTCHDVPRVRKRIAMTLSPRRTTLQAVAVPWVRMFQPARAALGLIPAAASAFWLALAAPVLFLTVAVVGLLIWNDTASAQIVFGPMPAASGPVINRSVPWQWVLQARSVAEVWADWHRRGPIGPAEVMVIAIPVLLVACVAFGAWLHLITAHEGGSVWASYRRAFRAVAACLGLLSALTVVLGGLMVATQHKANERLATDGSPPFEMIAMVMVATPVAIALLLAWVSAAVRSARLPVVANDPAPRCEGCGYDLTHVPKERRCPECGLDVGMSLAPSYSRPGCAWEDSHGPIVWTKTSLAVLAHPGVFYRRLRLRTPQERARRFALWHYAALGFAGAVWALAMSMGTNQTRFADLVVLPLAFLMWVPLCAWAIHRTVAALAVCWNLARAEPAAPHAMRKVIAYEGVFLWLPGLSTGWFIASIAIWHLWLSRLFPELTAATYRLMGGPMEVLVLCSGYLGLLLLWLWRYYVAIREVRWGNF